MFRRSIKNLWLVVATGLAFTCSLGVFVYFISSNNFTSDTAEASTYNEDQVIVAVNKRRIDNGLPQLIINEKLTKAAHSKAKHMQDNEYFSHIDAKTGKKWSDFIKEQDYDYVVAGENLANGFYDVDSMVQAWIDSPTHRENIMNTSVTETGMGISYGKLNGSPTIFVVQMFGKLE
ncbi:MAG: CAP domain-containing protein [bacterium]